MATVQQFIEEINNGYSFKGESIYLGAGILDGKVINESSIGLPLKTMNRHGLIAGATGTGKTKTLQLIAEGLSNAGVPVMLMDIKGDLSGIATPGVQNKIIEERYAHLAVSWAAKQFPVELLSLSNDYGVKMRATVSEFGPVLLSKILELNDNQEGLLSMIFKYADDHQLPILDLKDLISLIQYAGDQGKEEISKTYGNISTVSLNTILRKIIALQQQGADNFFGEKSFDTADLMRQDNTGKGYISILRVTDIQDKPKLFSTFMLQMLAELYATLPEAGDLAKPKLCLFIDEAHLIFNDASKVLLNQIETIIKLIRSKGVGIFFCTQNPQDIPNSILGQLGLKVQHALRAFTAADRKVIKLASENYPTTSFYKVDELLTQMGIGEAFVTLLNEKGIPTPLVHTYLGSPASRMDVLSPTELQQLLNLSVLVPKYNNVLDSYSAYEILNAKIAANINAQPTTSTVTVNEINTSKPVSKSAKPEPSTFEKILNSQAGKQAQRTITRTILGAIMKMFK